MWRGFVMVAAAACGRIGFRPQDDGPVGDGPVGGDGIALSCAARGALICDDFEIGTLQMLWEPRLGGGAVTVESSNAHSGTYSLLAHTDAITVPTTGQHALIRTFQALPAPAAELYARTWLFLMPAYPTASFDQFIDFVDNGGLGNSLSSLNGHIVNNDYTHSQYMESATSIPLGRWVCLELQIANGNTGTTKVFIDDVEITDSALPATFVQPPPTHILFGLEWTSNLSSWPAVDAWFDDIVVDDKPVPCTP